MLSFNIKPGTSAEELSERRKLAYALMQEGSSGAPVGHWLQGANRVAQSLIGGYDLYNTEEAGRREKAEASSLLGEALGLGGPQTSSAAPQRPVASQAAGYGQAAQPSAGATANVSSAVGRLPAGMRNNNPGNIKYFKGVNYPGVTGPSQNLDEGDPQMVFDNPQSGMNAMAQLAYKKYAGGKRSAQDLIAGNMGWTPGNTAAAANVARTMGISPTDDLQLNDPARMQQFMKALTLQEHGPASRQYGDELYANAASAVGGRSAPAAAPAPAGATAMTTSAPGASRSPLGVDPATARIIQKLSMNERTAPIAMKLLEAALTPKGGKQRYTASKQGILDTWTGQIKPLPGGAAGDAAEYGTSTKAFEDKDGNIQYMQFSKAGGGQAVALPEGARWRPDVEIKDTGTEFVPVSKQTGQVVGAPVAKNIIGKESQEEIGKLAGQARVALPAARTALDNARQTIAGLRNHPGLDAATGLSNWTDPRSWIAGTDSYDFLAKNQQATGQSFMIARDALKGAGQVTDFEGLKGEQAISNLNAAQSKKQYLDALDTLERMMDASYRDLETRANAGVSPTTPAPAATAPTTGPKQIQSQQEYQALPPGTQYVAPDGSIRTKR